MFNIFNNSQAKLTAAQAAKSNALTYQEQRKNTIKLFINNQFGQIQKLITTLSTKGSTSLTLRLEESGVFQMAGNSLSFTARIDGYDSLSLEEL